MQFKSNQAQEEAIHTIDGPVMIVSCPGSGKTTTLIRRIHHMLESGVNPSSVLMVTFTKAAADEMREKYIKFFGENPGILFMTIHALCFNLLIKEHKYSQSDVLIESEKRDFFFSVLRLHPEAEGDISEIAKSVATEMTSMKNNYGNPNTYEPERVDQELYRDICLRYEAWKTKIHKIDFDDMLIECRNMLLAEPSILQKWQGQFHYIQCDEYQDTNMIQRDILYMLSAGTGNLCVVGDDDQSIYRFRGARPEIMLHFMDDFPNAKRIMMGTNYRSAGEIVEKAAAMIKKNKVRYDKTFVSQRGIDGAAGYTEYVNLEKKADEREFLTKKIEELHENGTAYTDMAILYRTNRQAILPITALSAEEIPFYVVDAVKCIYDGWIFRDLKTYIDLSCGNYTSEEEMHSMVASVLNKPNRFLPMENFQNAEYSISGFRKAILPLAGMQNAYWKYTQALEEIDTWMRLFGPGIRSLDDSPAEILNCFKGARGIRYDKYMAEMAKFRRTDPSEYTDEFEELRSDAQRFQTIREWFSYAEWLRRLVRDESRKKNPDGVTLSTMHGSKGLEWKSVLIIDCNEGLIPHRDSAETDYGMEEERRLFYVGMTRAKDNLYVIHSGGKESPFVKEAQLMTAEERKIKSEVAKYLPGKKVMHKSFGEGKLVSYGPGKIVIDFQNGGRKILEFPGVFKKGLMKYC